MLLPMPVSISSDSPLTDPKDDVLGHAKYASHLAESILAMKPEDGLTIAINGSWGSGKSSVLNFINYYIETKKKEL